MLLRQLVLDYITNIYYQCVNKQKDFMSKQLSSIDNYLNPLTENPVVGTHFKPEPPFDMYTRGVVYYHKRDDRLCITLYTPVGESTDGISIKKNMFVGTYLYSVKLFSDTGTLIPEGYQVDHKDNNRWNDTYDNLQLLSPIGNAEKEGLRVGCIWYVMICPVCKKHWNATFNNTQFLPACKDIVFYCSPECRVIFRSTLFPFKDFLPLRQWIAKNQVYQTVRKWKEENREEVVKVHSEEMLNFDLATASGRSIAYDSPRLLSDFAKKEKAKHLRLEGKSWGDIGFEFGLSGSQARLLFMDETTGTGVGGRKEFIHSEIIRLSQEGKSTGELAKMFEMDPNSITRIKREKKQK